MIGNFRGAISDEFRYNLNSLTTVGTRVFKIINFIIILLKTFFELSVFMILKLMFDNGNKK